MPASPFGLAYGLGAGIAGAQQQMQARQMAAQQMAQQALQQQLLQHQVSQQQAEDQAFSQPINPETRTVPTYETQELPTAYSAPGVPFGTETYSQQVQTGTTQEPVEYVTPYQKMAYDTAQRAQMLRQKGFGWSAFTLEQQASQYQQMHHDMALKMAGQAVNSGSPQSAVPYLRSVGLDVNNMSQDPHNSENILVTRDNGETGSVPRMSVSLIGADPTKAAEVLSMDAWRKAQELYRQQVAGAQQTRATAYAKGQESLAEHRQEQDRIAEKRVDAQKAAFGSGGAKTPAKQILWKAAEATAQQLHPGASAEEIFKYTSEDPRVSTARTNPQAGLSMQIRSYQAEQKNYLAPDGRAPVNDPKDPLAQRYYELQGKIDEARNALMRPTTHTPTTQPRLGPSGDPSKTPGGYVPGDYSKDGKYYLSPVKKKWVLAGSK